MRHGVSLLRCDVVGVSEERMFEHGARSNDRAAAEEGIPGGRRIVNPGALLRDQAGSDAAVLAPGTFGILDVPVMEFSVHRADTGERIEILVRDVER